MDRPRPTPPAPLADSSAAGRLVCWILGAALTPTALDLLAPTPQGAAGSPSCRGRLSGPAPWRRGGGTRGSRSGRWRRTR
ncbi:hypothetical protein DI273_13400 [Streptomyces violascens]|nr:hypothetical protein DI273_13400 [Streptomyces violascens]